MNSSRSYNFFYNIMPDGTVKQINPFTGTEVWAVPGRGDKPLMNEIPAASKEIDRSGAGKYCSFCESRYYEVPPEKARLVKDGGQYRVLTRVPPDKYNDTVAEFRRLGNLFEIVTIDYWKKNYDYRLTKDAAAWRDSYLAIPRGAEHIDAILNYKLKMSSRSEQDIRQKLLFNKENMMDAFFGGCHELIIARKHYADGATFETQLYASGEMTEEEHFQYFRFTVEAMRDMLTYNRYIRYISVFQNWLRPAGASFDHLHKQIVGLDEWGNSMLLQIQMLRDDPNIFNELGVNFAAQYNLVFAENDFAVASVGIGCGAGEFALGLAGTLLTSGVLFGLGLVEGRINEWRVVAVFEMELEPSVDVHALVQRLMSTTRARLRSYSVSKARDGLHGRVTVVGSAEHLQKLEEIIWKAPTVNALPRI